MTALLTSPRLHLFFAPFVGVMVGDGVMVVAVFAAVLVVVGVGVVKDAFSGPLSIAVLGGPMASHLSLMIGRNAVGTNGGLEV